jgi:hypothetical protein
MQTGTIERTEEFVDVTFSDWEGNRRVQLEGVPRNATVSELLDEVRRLMELPTDTGYQAVRGQVALNNMQTLREAGIEADTALEIHPEVTAG